jgi:hypothetical protein
MKVFSIYLEDNPHYFRVKSSREDDPNKPHYQILASSYDEAYAMALSKHQYGINLPAMAPDVFDREGVFHIRKSFRLSDTSYTGPRWDVAGIRDKCKPFYTSYKEAMDLCDLLNEANGVPIYKVYEVKNDEL